MSFYSYLTHIFSYCVVIDIWIIHRVLFKHGCVPMWHKDKPTRHSVMSVYVMSGPSFRVLAYIVYLSTVCVRECAFAGAALPVCTHTPVSSLHGPRRVNIRAKPFEAGLIASCMSVWGVFSPYAFTLLCQSHCLWQSGSLYVCHFFIIILRPALALNIRSN